MVVSEIWPTLLTRENQILLIKQEGLFKHAINLTYKSAKMGVNYWFDSDSGIAHLGFEWNMGDSNSGVRVKPGVDSIFNWLESESELVPGLTGVANLWFETAVNLTKINCNFVKFRRKCSQSMAVNE